MRRGDAWRRTQGQASILLIGGLAGVLIAVVIAGAVAMAVGREAAAQRAADLAAVAGAKAMHANYQRLFESAFIDDVPNPRHLTKADYLKLGRAAARATATANGAPHTVISFPDESTIAPVRIKVVVRETVEVGRERARIRVDAEAQLGASAQIGFAHGGGYEGPLAYRQGKPMRPDVAQAFDRMEQAARQDGVALAINSGFRSDAEQAVLFARNPNPKMVAPPGQSLHRNGTELDLGPPAAYGWLDANGRRFHFVQRYSWEDWHWGYTLNAGFARRRRRQGGNWSRRSPELRAGTIRPRAQRGRPALERVRHAARRPALRRIELQPLRPAPTQARRSRAVHAGHGPRLRPQRPLRPDLRHQRPGAPHARSAPHVRLRATRAGGLQRWTGPGAEAAAASRRTPRPRATSPGSSASCRAPASRSRPATP